jgi:hypothetical protein
MINYLGTKGPDSLIYKTNDRISISDKLILKDNQIFYNGKQVTVGYDIKKSPLMLLNHNEVLYLSDKGRGVGLTGLRKIKLGLLH